LKLDLFPTGLASAKTKRQWLIYELLRYKSGLSNLVSFKTMLSIAYAIFIFYIIGNTWLAVGMMAIGIGLIDYTFHLIHLELYAGFYIDLAETCFSEKGGLGGPEHDLRILMNRVDNYLTGPTEKRESLYKDLEFCYAQLRVKDQLREVIHEAHKGNVQKEGKDQKA